jgi:hypothetical protein
MVQDELLLFSPPMTQQTDFSQSVSTTQPTQIDGSPALVSELSRPTRRSRQTRVAAEVPHAAAAAAASSSNAADGHAGEPPVTVTRFGRPVRSTRHTPSSPRPPPRPLRERKDISYKEPDEDEDEEEEADGDGEDEEEAGSIVCDGCEKSLAVGDLVHRCRKCLEMASDPNVPDGSCFDLCEACWSADPARHYHLRLFPTHTEYDQFAATNSRPADHDETSRVAAADIHQVDEPDEEEVDQPSSKRQKR